MGKILSMPSKQREYLETHPWISFTLEANKLPHEVWMNLGEILSKCDHVSGAPLAPAAAQELNYIYLTKGIHATTSIEGNTLTEDEVARRVKGNLDLPESMEYQGEEIDHLVEALNRIRLESESRNLPQLSTDRIKEFNRLILQGQPHDEEVKPGEFRTHSVVVGNAYKGPPAEDVEYLMDRFIHFINKCLVTDNPVYRQPVLIIRAVLAHIYLAWIHPFGDGNGRTARLIETQLLFEAGVPSPSAHLLSDFYNKTRSRYYQALKEASINPNLDEGLTGFISYAVKGFVEGLQEQVNHIEDHQMEIAWITFVHERFDEFPKTPAQHRKRTLALSLPAYSSGHEGVKKSDVAKLNTELAALYATTGPKTLTRDLNDLVKMQLVTKIKGKFFANKHIVAAFLPPSHEPLA